MDKDLLHADFITLAKKHELDLGLLIALEGNEDCFIDCLATKEFVSIGEGLVKSCKMGLVMESLNKMRKTPCET